MAHQPPAAGVATGRSSFALPPNVLKELLQQGFQHDGTKISPDALAAALKLCEAFVSEALSRATDEAASVGADEVEKEHLEKILPSLLLDFGP